MSVQNEPNSAELLDRYRDGDERAAELIFERYSTRLVALASSRLSSRLSSRVDAEDVTLSAWRSFFIGAGEGRFHVGRGGDLWRLLVSITLHKLYRQARRHSAERRSVAVEYALGLVSAELLPANEREPIPEHAATLADELQAIMQSLDPFTRRTFELRMQGEQIEEIARVTGRSERTVRRALATLRENISARADRLQ